MILVVLPFACIGQYDYFHNVYGEFGDNQTEAFSNVEVLDDGYVTWGGGSDNGTPLLYLRKFSFNGELLESLEIDFEDEQFYTGVANSLQWNNYTQELVVMQGSAIDGDLVGRILAFNADLEIVQDLYFNQYDPSTYFFNFLIEPDGYVVLGEYGPLSNSRGTFLMKMDFEGAIAWSEVIQPEVFQEIYRNVSIIPVQDGYLMSGWGNDGEYFGVITRTNDSGEVVYANAIVDPDELRSNLVYSILNSNNEVITVQAISFADVPEIGNPNVYFNKIRISKYNPDTEEFYWSQDFFEEEEMILGGAADVEATQDGGVILLGGRYGYLYDSYVWMLKLDSLGNEEWFKEYTYQTCDNCLHYPYDLEIAPDGGYVVSGSFVNFDLDALESPWLFKVDACGDLEWLGCEPVSVGLEEQSKLDFNVYPNPAEDELTIQLEDQNEAETWRILDLQGRTVQEGVIDGLTTRVTPELPSGLYVLMIEPEVGEVGVKKIQVL